MQDLENQILDLQRQRQIYKAAEANRESAQQAAARLAEAEADLEEMRWKLAVAEAELKDLTAPHAHSWYGFGFLGLICRQQKDMREGSSR